jgi:hypothetical protein
MSSIAKPPRSPSSESKAISQELHFIPFDSLHLRKSTNGDDGVFVLLFSLHGNAIEHFENALRLIETILHTDGWVLLAQHILLVPRKQKHVPKHTAALAIITENHFVE